MLMIESSRRVWGTGFVRCPTVRPVALAAMLVVAGCAPGQTGGAAPPDSAAEAIARIALDSRDRSADGPATEAAERYVRTVERAINAPDRNPMEGLDAVATGPALRNVIEQLNLMRLNKLIARGHSDLNLRYLGRASATSYVTNCAPNGQVVMYHSDTGEIAENTDSGFAVSIFSLRSDGTTRKVERVKTFSEPYCPD